MTSDKAEPAMESSIWIARPPEEVWGYLADISNETQWREAATDAKWISDPPHGVGSTGFLFFEGAGDWPVKMTEWEEPYIMSWDVTGGRFEGSHGSYRIAPEDGGSRVTNHSRFKRSALMRILLLIMKRRIKRGLDADLEKLKAIMEA